MTNNRLTNDIVASSDMAASGMVTIDMVSSSMTTGGTVDTTTAAGRRPPRGGGMATEGTVDTATAAGQHPSAGGDAVTERTVDTAGRNEGTTTPALDDDPAVTPDLARARALAAAVPDPEVPVLTIDDLGVLREVTQDDDGALVVRITPTYSGCPAMDTIRADVLEALRNGGFGDVRVDLVLSPAWTTDWMSEDGRRKLREYGIAPPATETERRSARQGGGPVALTLGMRCPQCGSLDTEQLSRFGSTACKSLWRCRACAEPFDHFKTL